MNPLSGDVQIPLGDTVFDRDDDKLGSVVALAAAFLMVERGLLRKAHYYVPVSAVNACHDRRVYLTVTKNEIEERAWDVPSQITTDVGGASLRWAAGAALVASGSGTSPRRDQISSARIASGAGSCEGSGT